MGNHYVLSYLSNSTAYIRNYIVYCVTTKVMAAKVNYTDATCVPFRKLDISLGRILEDIFAIVYCKIPQSTDWMGIAILSNRLSIFVLDALAFWKLSNIVERYTARVFHGTDVMFPMDCVIQLLMAVPVIPSHNHANLRDLSSQTKWLKCKGIYLALKHNAKGSNCILICHYFPRLNISHHCS